MEKFIGIKKHAGIVRKCNYSKFIIIFILWFAIYSLWQYGLWSFQAVGTKLERFLPKNQHTHQRKLLNFENWCSGQGVP